MITLRRGVADLHAAAFVGRIGGLAVALGIGVGITAWGGEVAWASSEDASSSTGNAASSSAPGTPAASSSSVRSRTSRPDTPSIGTRSRAGMSGAAATPSGTNLSNSASAAVTVHSPLVTPGKADAVPVPLSGTNPQASATDSASRLARHAARRQSASVAKTGASAESVNPIAALFFNQTPSSPVFADNSPGQGVDGLVKGIVIATDIDSSTLTFSVTSDPSHGSVVVGSDGSYTYTPDPSFAATGVVDSFGVTVSDAASGFHIHGLGGLLNLITFGLLGDSGHTSTTRVTSTVLPFAPGGYNQVQVGAPNPWTGVVTGSVSASNPAGAALTFGGSTSTSKGTVSVNASSGEFIYTPTETARHAAAQDGATASSTTDSFIVTINDGTGGTASIPVSVDIGSTNSAPVVGAISVGSPSASTGTVNGTLSATDPDGDSLTFSFPVTTAKGSLTHNVLSVIEGSFIYTPTAAALNTAAAPNATLADKTDRFVIAINDQHGGVVSVPVTVSIGRATDNNASFGGTATVGSPDSATGVVSGQINATNPNGHVLTYGGTANTAKGRLVVDYTTGAFMYAPTSIARQNASLPTATSVDKTDSFTVTITDDYGASAVVPVTVAVSPFPSNQGNETYTVAASVPVGMYPQKIVVSPTGTRAYVTNWLSQTVSVIDTTTKNLIATVAVGYEPRALAINPAGTRVYVANEGTNSVSVVDTNTNTVVKTVVTGNAPTGIVVNSNGTRVYVTNENSHTVSVIDTATNAVLNTIDVGDIHNGTLFSPIGVALSPDGSRLFVGGEPPGGGSGLISVIDTATNKVTKTFAVPDWAWPMAVSPNGSRLYVSGVTGVISVVDTGTSTVVASIQVGSTSGLAVSPNGSRLYATRSNKTVAVIDTATNQVINEIGVINAPNGVAVSPDGNCIYVTIQGSDIDPAGRNTVSVITRSG